MITLEKDMKIKRKEIPTMSTMKDDTLLSYIKVDDTNVDKSSKEIENLQWFVDFDDESYNG